MMMMMMLMRLMMMNNAKDKPQNMTLGGMVRYPGSQPKLLSWLPFAGAQVFDPVDYCFYRQLILHI